MQKSGAFPIEKAGRREGNDAIYILNVMEWEQFGEMETLTATFAGGLLSCPSYDCVSRVPNTGWCGTEK